MHGHGRRTGFTLVELLVTIGIILLILGTVLAALSFASRRAQRANTEFLMTSIRNGLERFKADHGYYPPTLGVPTQLTSAGIGATLGWPGTPPSTNLANIGAGRDLLVPPFNTDGSGTTKIDQWNTVPKRLGLQRWHSTTTLPEYLLGYGDRSADGYGTVVNGSTTLPGGRETPRLGLRSPGRDGVWGAALSPVVASEVGAAGLGSLYSGATFNASPTVLSGLYAQRNLAPPPRITLAATTFNDTGNNDSAAIPRTRINLEGKVFGPYMDVRDESVIGGINGWDQVDDPDGGGSWWEPRIVRANEVTNFDALPKVFIDYWGRPIRYFRKAYVQLDPSLPDPSTNGSQFDLGDFFALRPVSIPRGADADGIADLNGDTSTLRALQAASYGLHSCGPDRRWNPLRRVDSRGFNADNIVEFGP
ncbi:MAG: type II secretion system protein [Phycisphaeraceae bacterium]|nr:type II secretion system protein [Phycisphaeraceae bacterium]